MIVVKHSYFAMTERQRKLSLALYRLSLIEQTEISGEKKVSKAQSRMLSPAIYDVLTKEPMMVKACKIRGIDINELTDKASQIQFLLKADVSAKEESANDTESN